jgi:hypothetical protein
VTLYTLSVLPQVASVSPVDIKAFALVEMPDLGPDLPVRPLECMDADQSPDFGPNFEIVPADFRVAQLDAEVMPDFGPDFDGDIEMDIEPTSHSTFTPARRNIESGSSSHPLASLHEFERWETILHITQPTVSSQ